MSDRDKREEPVDVGKAIARVENYVKQRTGRRNLDPDEVHAVDAGCATAGVLTLTDLLIVISFAKKGMGA